MIGSVIASADQSTKDSNYEDFLTFLKKQNAKDVSKMPEELMMNHMFVNMYARSSRMIFLADGC